MQPGPTSTLEWQGSTRTCSRHSTVRHGWRRRPRRHRHPLQQRPRQGPRGRTGTCCGRPSPWRTTTAQSMSSLPLERPLRRRAWRSWSWKRPELSWPGASLLALQSENRCTGALSSRSSGASGPLHSGKLPLLLGEIYASEPRHFTRTWQEPSRWRWTPLPLARRQRPRGQRRATTGAQPKTPGQRHLRTLGGPTWRHRPRKRRRLSLLAAQLLMASLAVVGSRRTLSCCWPSPSYEQRRISPTTTL
mmetsp:Transcript_64865/g.141345  ORF Transcript_64865/g.141345 Transcript_64865/m.141345 type:complete len:247 (-) Transcript_64865:719-1459(-)